MAHAWRSLLFGMEGWRNYLKAGYEARAKHFDGTAATTLCATTHLLVSHASLLITVLQSLIKELKI